MVGCDVFSERSVKLLKVRYPHWLIAAKVLALCMPHIEFAIRHDLPRDECVSDIMEQLVTHGVPYELAAQMAEDVFENFEHQQEVAATLQDMRLMIGAARRLFRLIMALILILVIANAVSLWLVFIR